VLFTGIVVCLPVGCAGTTAEEEKAPPAPVKWETARLLVLEEWTDLVGTSQPLPQQMAFVSAPVEGRVVSLFSPASGKPVIEGQQVHKGEEIAHLDDHVLQANRAKLQAAEEEMKAQISKSEADVQAAQLDVDRVEKLAQRSASSGGTEVSVSRLVRDVELPKARIAYRSAQAQLEAAQAKLNAAKEELKTLDAQIALYALRTPIAGRLGRIRVALGQTLAVGTVVTEVVDLDSQIDVLCFVPPATARRLSIGQSARIGGFEKQSAFPISADPEGKVEFIADQAEPETGNMAVKVRFPNKDARLRANTTLRVRVLTKPGKECLAIPEAALTEDQDPPSVVVVEDVETKKNEEGKDEQVGKARRLQAIVGIRDRVLHQVEIIRLEDKEKKWKGDVEHALFVVEKAQGLQTGDVVRFEEEEEEE
jgi:RND family efflux transporter MFP subunit